MPGFLYGTILSLATAGFSWILTRLVFGNLYFFGRLLPVFMAFYLLVAWLIHLRKDNFMGSGRKAAKKSKEERIPPAPAEGRSNNPLSPGFFADFSEAVLPRGQAARTVQVTDKTEGRRQEGRRNGKSLSLLRGLPAADHGLVLVWAALWLAAISIFFYFSFGVGAKYFIP